MSKSSKIFILIMCILTAINITLNFFNYETGYNLGLATKQLILIDNAKELICE